MSIGSWGCFKPIITTISGTTDESSYQGFFTKQKVIVEYHIDNSTQSNPYTQYVGSVSLAISVYDITDGGNTLVDTVINPGERYTETSPVYDGNNNVIGTATYYKMKYYQSVPRGKTYKTIVTATWNEDGTTEDSTSDSANIYGCPTTKCAYSLGTKVYFNNNLFNNVKGRCGISLSYSDYPQYLGMDIYYSVDGGINWINIPVDNYTCPYASYLDYKFDIDISSVSEGSSILFKYRVCSNKYDWSDYVVSSSIIKKVYSQPTFYHLMDNIIAAYPKKQDGSIDLPYSYNPDDGKYYTGIIPQSIWSDFMDNVENLYHYVLAEYLDNIDNACYEFPSINFNIPNKGTKIELPTLTNVIAVIFKCCLALFVNNQIPYNTSYYIQLSDGGFTMYDPERDGSYESDVANDAAPNLKFLNYKYNSSYSAYSIYFNYLKIYDFLRDIDRAYNMCINFMAMLSYDDYPTRFSMTDFNCIVNNTVTLQPNKSYYISRN